MNLIWNTCNRGSWCSFLSVNLDHSHFNGLEGVYIIWQGGGPIIKVGQGLIRNRLSAHREDRAVTSYGNLFVTWAAIPSKSTRDGVERFLGDRLKPRVGDVFPNVVPIEVNLPWSYQ